MGVEAVVVAVGEPESTASAVVAAWKIERCSAMRLARSMIRVPFSEQSQFNSASPRLIMFLLSFRMVSRADECGMRDFVWIK